MPSCDREPAHTMPVDIRIRQLQECPQHAAVLAEWYRTEWPEHFRNWPQERIIEEYFTPAPDKGGLPVVLVAEVVGDPIGTVTLRAHWRDSHKHLGPWLGGLYVQPKFRSRNVARRLIEALHAEATRRGHTAVYGGTKNLGRFLRSLGWEFQEMIGVEKESLALFRWKSAGQGKPR